MNILIIGATRGIGLQLLERAVARKHSVTVLARNPAKISLQHERLRVVPGDILDPASVRRAMAGQQAVCSCIGISFTRQPVTVFSEGTQNVLAAMQEAGVKRFVCITGIGAGDSRNHGGFLYDKIFQPLLLKTIYEDKDRQEALIKASATEWIIVRPALLTDAPPQGRYRALTDLAGVTAGKISRADVAEFMLDQLDSDRYLRQAVLLTD